MKKVTYCVALLVLCAVTAWTSFAADRVERLSRRNATGHIAVRARGRHLPANAQVNISRTHAKGKKDSIRNGFGKRHHGKKGGKARFAQSANGAAKATPNVLAMYDISISDGGKKWQPAANEPVQVTIDLTEPVPVQNAASLGVVHLADDGTVEELEASRRGFTFNADKTAVTAFWFDASGFSVYAITEENGVYTPNRRMYDFYSLDFDTTSDTYNTYVPRYFTTVEGNKTFRQIVKSGEILARPEVLPSPLGRTFIGWFLYDPDNANQTVDGVEYDAEGYATTKFDFTKPITFENTPDGDGEVFGTREYILRARFAHEGYVIFHEQPVGNDWPITAVRRTEMAEVVNGNVTNMVATVDISDLKVTYDDTADENEQHENSAPRMIFRGWSETPVMPGSLTDTNGNPVVILQSPFVFQNVRDTEAGPRDLYPVFVNINWLTFFAAETGSGATYIPPRYLYQDEGTNRFPVSSRTGYVFNGWWTGTNSTAVQVADASGVLRTNFSNTELDAIRAWGGKIEDGNLKLSDNVTLYGHWNMGYTKYTVVVMRQSLNDDRDAVEKTYDFACSATNIVRTESNASVADGFKQLETSVSSSLKLVPSQTTADFEGFYYSHCDEDKTVKGDGTTVLRVYYDRYRFSYVFRKSSGTTSYFYTPSTASPYIYTASDLDYYTYTATSLDYYVYTSTTKNYESYETYTTTDGNGSSQSDVTPNSSVEYYRLNNNSYTRVYFRNNRWRTSDRDNGTTYKNGTVYVKVINELYGTSDESNPNDSNTFRIYYVNSRWRTSNSNNGTTYSGTRYEKTVNTETLYGKTADDYFELQYVNGEWQNSETGDAYTGTRYTRTQNYPGDVYGTENNASPYDVTPFVVSYENGNWITNGAVYAGTRYTRAANTALAEHYGTNNGASPYSSTPFRIYFVNDAWRTSNSASGTVYEGTRYVRVNSIGNSYAPSSDVADPCMTGLYGQPLSKYGYDWPTDYKWKIEGSSNVNMTYLETFNYTEYGTKDSTAHTRVVTFTQDGDQGTSVIYHVLQGLDGTYSEENAIRNLCAGGNFSFTDKFEGFSVYGFTEGTGSFTANPQNNASVGGSSNNKYPLYVYHQRNKYSLTLVDSYNLTQYRTVEVYYGAPLASVTNNLTVAPTEQSMQAGYSFTGWYSDQSTSTKFNFDRTMPRNNLIAYAGWETEWYLIKIDPNFGKLPSGQSTWFWEPYNGDPIEEYSATTRSFVESLNGTWFYAIKNRDYYGYPDEWVPGEAAERGAYYTQDQTDPAIVQDGKRYSPAVNVYRYSGWYEVDPDTGDETLYAFGQPVQRNTLLRLHWKHIGMYHLYYDPGVGTMSDGDENETTFEILDAGVYADNSDVLVTRTANPPKGYSFAGWKIRYGGDEVLHPGQKFFFNAAYTVTALDKDGNPIKQLILDAVYEKVSTTSLTTDANGGTLDPTVATDVVLAYANAPTLFTNVTENTRTVSGMRNNAFGTLSDGSGYYCTVKDENGNDIALDFMGWNTKADGTGTHFDGGSFIGLDTIGTENETGANTLYAEWAVKVYFDKANSAVVDWRHSDWNTNVFTWVESKQMYCQTTTLNGYATYPNVVFEPTNHTQMFAFWSTNRYTDASLLTPHDFSQPVKGPMTLYARYTDLIEVEFHAVDTTPSVNVLKDSEWIGAGNNVFRIGNYTNVSFEDAPTGYVTAPGDYEYAFTCIAHDKDSISEAKKVKRLYFNAEHDVRAVYIEYADGTTGPLESGMEIFVAYFKNPRPIDIAYVAMQEDGRLLPTSEEQVSASITTNAWNMADTVTAPLASTSGYSYYAFAIGETNAENGSQLHFITEAESSDSNRPQLALRNTWQGLEYSTDGGKAWHSYGSDAELYVVYFKSQPTIINFFEQTIGTADDMATEFEYMVTVSNVTTTVTQQRTRTVSTSETNYRYYSGGYKNYPYSYKYNNTTYYFGANGYDWGSWSSVTVAGSSTAGEEAAVSTHTLSNGGIDAVTLFASVVGPGNWSNGGTNATTRTTGGWFSTTYLDLTETQVRTIVTNLQTVVIRQVPKQGFTTTNDNGDGAYSYTATSTPAPSSSSVTFTNTRDAAPLELHVAFSENGAFSNGDDDWRSTTTNDYTISVGIGTDGSFGVTANDLADATDSLFKAGADLGDSRFMGIYYGTTNENGNVVLEGPVTSVGFVKPNGSEYYELCLNGDTSLPLGDYQVYYVYCEVPRIYYVATGSNGALTKRDTVTFEGQPISMGNAGETAATQGTLLEVSADAAYTVAVGGGSANFHVPMVLDGKEHGSLDRVAFGFGATDLTSTNDMDGVVFGNSIQLKVVDMVLKWSADGETWGTFSGKPAVYVIYKEAGHDLTINANSFASDADKATDTFTVTISSGNLVDGVEYVISGYSENGAPVETVTPVNGVITLTLKSGDSVTIQSLQDDGMHPYVITQTPDAEDYEQTGVLIDGHAPITPSADGSVTTFLDHDKVVEFTDTKSYTVQFVNDNGAPIMVDDGNGGEVALAKKVPYGTTPAEFMDGVEDPTKPMDGSYIYRFEEWGPAIETVGSNTTYTAAYREIKIPQAAQRAADTNLVVSLSAEEAQAREEALLQALKDVGIDLEDPDYSEEAATEELNRVDPNGLRHWENLVTGTSTNHMLLSTVTMTNHTESTISLVQDEDPQAPIARALGYEVLYDLKRLYNVKDVANREWRRVDGPGETPSFTVHLIDANGNSLGAAGYYRVYTLIIPVQDLSITNEIPSTNIIGVLEVNSPLKNTMTAVPWKALATAPEDAVPVAVQNYVDIGQLENGDVINALDQDGTYQQWTLEDGEWKKAAATVREVKGMMKTVSTPKAEDRTLERGEATWVSRNGTDKPYFLVGQYTGENVEIEIAGGEKAVKGSTMITNPTLYPLSINDDIDWGGNPSADDVIQVPNGLGVPQELIWSDGEWGYSAKVYDAKKKRYVKEWRTGFTISPGTGFWYYRTGGAFKITIDVDQID